MKRTLPILLALVAATASFAADKYLTIGDAAPSLKTAKWLKGEPLPAFEKGKLYVVEFWATWCHPCIDNIPHLTELAKKYDGKVSIIGISIWESAKPSDGDLMKRVTTFVKDEGEKMDYHVAADDVKKNTIADTYMKAASEEGIPCSFIVDKDGKVAWIGHPAKMEETLQKVIAGTWDSAGAREKREVEQKVTRPINEAMAKKDYPGAIKAIDAAVAQRPQLEYSLTYPLLVALYHSDLQRGKTFSQKILKDSNNANGAYQMMSSIFATETTLSKEAYAFGLGIIDEGTAQGVGVFMFKAMKAATYFNSGDKAKAIEVAEESVALIAKEPKAPPEMVSLLKKNLAKYKAAK